MRSAIRGATKKLLGTGAAVAVSLVTLATWATPASAHADELWWQGLVSGEVEYGRISWTTYHYYVAVCDAVADGRGVAVEYITTNGTYGRFSDANGSQYGCASRTLTASTGPLRYVRFCISGVGCGWGHYHRDEWFRVD